MIFQKIRQNWLVKKPKYVRRKKTSRAQIFRYFRYKSRKNNFSLINLVNFFRKRRKKCINLDICFRGKGGADASSSGIRPPHESKGTPFWHHSITSFLVTNLYVNEKRKKTRCFGQEVSKKFQKRLFWPVFVLFLTATQKLIKIRPV